MATYTSLTSLDTSKLAAGDTISLSYTGAAQSATLPAGTYTFTCLGAQGGYRSSSTYGGKGGKAVGTLKLTADTKIYARVGGSGNTGGTNGGFNGGGRRNKYNGGGGATDVRIGSDSLYARVIVAGGGGSDGATSRGGGTGGGTTGGNTTASNYGTGGYGATQTGNSGGSSYVVSSQSTSTTTQAGIYAGFGFGGNGIYRSNGCGGAGGGGWYGGSGTYPDSSGDDDKGGGGGSGYVYTSSTASNYPSGCLLNSSYYLSDTSMSNGVQTGNGSLTIAVVEIAGYTVTWNANGGSTSKTSQIVKKGSAIGTLPTATRDGYNFKGWYTAASGGTQITASTVPTAAVTYYAHWAAVHTYDASPGTFSDGTASKTIEEGDTVPTPSRDGFVFEGWTAYKAQWLSATRIKVSDAWHVPSELFIKVSGAWKTVTKGYIKKDDTWHLVYVGHMMLKKKTHQALKAYTHEKMKSSTHGE